jgi:hypothetical protein
MERKNGMYQFTGLATIAAVLFASHVACSLLPGGKPASGRESSTPRATGGGSAEGFACFASFEGVTCLSAEGWKTYTKKNSDMPIDYIRDLAACSDMKIYAAGSDGGVASFDGEKWELLAMDTYYVSYHVACAPDGGVWAEFGYKSGIGRYADGRWTVFPTTDFDSSEEPGIVSSLAVAPDGTVWAATNDSVAMYDGSFWKEFKEGSGFSGRVSQFKLAIDSKNRVYATIFGNLYRYENGEWRVVDQLDFSLIQSLAVDPQDRLWVNTVITGAHIFDGSGWSSVSYQGGDIHSNGVNQAAFDRSGRVWLATAYGIDVRMDGYWTPFRMDNAELTENEFAAVAVVGDGPPLPEAETKGTGSITGVVRDGGELLADAEMEICVESLGGLYFGETPCSGQPFVRQAKTDAVGKFSVSDLPVGFYVMNIRIGDAWNRLWLENYSVRVPVVEGQETDAGEMKPRPLTKAQ